MSSQAASNPLELQNDDIDRSSRGASRGRWWPLERHDAALFALGYVVLTAVWVGIGMLITGPLDSSVGAADLRVVRDFEAGRTDRSDTLSHYGTMLSETQVKVVLTAVIAIALLAVCRKWDAALLVVAPLVLEASVFITVTFIVRRDRPPVERLDGSPVGSSFPSGHVAAAVVYGAFAIVAFRYGHRVLGWVLAVLTVVVAAIVAWSRMYRGMHFPSDVVGGALLGVAALAVTTGIVGAAIDRRRQGATS